MDADRAICLHQLFQLSIILGQLPGLQHIDLSVALDTTAEPISRGFPNLDVDGVGVERLQSRRFHTWKKHVNPGQTHLQAWKGTRKVSGCWGPRISKQSPPGIYHTPAVDGTKHGMQHAVSTPAAANVPKTACSDNFEVEVVQPKDRSHTKPILQGS